jgi:HSP20 family protein
MVYNMIVSGRDFETVQQRMERLMHTIFDEMRPAMFAAEKVWKPPVDSYETAAEIIVLVEVAGMSRKSINVTMDNNVLKVSGIRSDYVPSANTKMHQMEIDYGKFERLIRITIPIDAPKTSAQYKEGFLRITIPKVNCKQQVPVDIPDEE